ncbi:sorting nexin lst-4 isoform X1 [Galendromus occidentalis]|uniref:Sorting nexin n=1 Tax=Galendromus occidentalis TaxID=34638 RepID=A0AAJ6QUB5_9ACAR|nr:sorting nexin lst-4 isoform X1 [Galendromus occidentalis]
MAHIKVKVLYDFDAQAPGEISIREGDTVTVTSRDVGEGWCEGINAKGENGLFPEAYVDLDSSPDVSPSTETGLGSSASVSPSAPLTLGRPSDDDWGTPEGLLEMASKAQPTAQQGEVGLFPESYISTQPPHGAPSVGNGSDATSDWDDWDDDDDTISSKNNQGLGGPGNFGLIIPRDTSDVANKGDGGAVRTGTVKRFNSSNSVNGDAPRGTRSRSNSLSAAPKSVMRFSNFVKSGGEAFLLGTARVAINSADYVTIVNNGGVIQWSQPYPEAMYKAEISSPKKESKLKGLKSFIAYAVIPSFNGLPVYRRYKHFDWLHERLVEKYSLIPIPPLPDKQVTGRYEHEFIEHRMQQLQLWVNRMCRHPVLSQSAVWHHFLTCGDEKQWKGGKRNAEKDDLQGANFFNAIQAPETPLDVSSVERQTEAFIRFTSRMDDSVQSLFRTAQDQMKRCQGPYKRECVKIATALKEVADAFDLDQNELDTQLNASIRNTGETYNKIGQLYDENLRHNWENMADTLYEYRGILSSWPDIINIHRTFLTKRREYQRQRDEGKVSAEDYVDINRRTDVVTYATLAEITHFQQERVRDYREMMHTFLQGQINFYEQVVEELRTAQSRYR